jgi:hypothetical protein
MGAPALDGTEGGAHIEHQRPETGTTSGPYRRSTGCVCRQEHEDGVVDGVLLYLVRRQPVPIAQDAHLIQTDRIGAQSTTDLNDAVERVLLQGTLVAAAPIAVDAEESNGERRVGGTLCEEVVIVCERSRHGLPRSRKIMNGVMKSHRFEGQAFAEHSERPKHFSSEVITRSYAVPKAPRVTLGSVGRLSVCAATGIYYAIKSKKKASTPVAANALPASTVPLSDTYANHTTPFNEDGGGNVRFLDRQNVDCFVDDRVNGGLNSFVFSQEAPDLGKVRYTYTCGSSADSVTKDKCRTVSTNKDDDGDGSPKYLDRHVVACNDGEEISQFKMVQPDGINAGKIRYDYTCYPTAKKSCREATTATTPFGWGPSGVAPPGASTYGNAKANVQFLDKHAVKCEKGEVLKSFGAIQPGGPGSNTLAYKYTCCS